MSLKENNVNDTAPAKTFGTRVPCAKLFWF